MASGGCVMAVTLLFFTSFTQGNFGIQLDRVDSINAIVGQRVNLSCLMEKEQDSSIGQITWRKFVKGKEDQIVIYNPQYGPPVYSRENIVMHMEMSGGRLRGSVLQLLDLKAQDSGDYTCELTTFPLGTMKTDIHLWVTDVQLSARVTWPNGGVREGDNVTILCNSTPPADFYSLWPSKNKSSIFKSNAGMFTLSKVTRDNSDLYICQPGNSASGLSFYGHNVTIQVTVNYLVEIECDNNRSIEVTAGQNVTISCTAKASQPSQYTWRKGNVTVATSGSLHLLSVSSEEAGVYTLTAVVKDTGLQRETEFNITVQTDSADLPPSTVPPRSTATIENSYNTTLWGTDITTTTEGRATGSVATSPTWTTNSTKPDRTAGVTVSPTRAGDQLGDPSTPSTANVSTISTNRTRLSSEVNSMAAVTTHPTLPFNTMLPGSEETSTDTRVERNTFSPRPPTAALNRSIIIPTMVYRSNSSSNESPDPDGTKYAVLIVLPFLALMFVIVFLYRRHVVQKRMDMPPFKPPPPPVKYTSVRTQDVTMTDILKR
ncbi:hypothetical protein AAFF_G00371620 [Aldrovandia affinis]|uniref:Ig-like domain-containing protein n=1 Tax=Aldrovandia affinis TaxID=143900 RepID=A0AAD7WMG2_9TELE|nr:hypothetical protein AAFF_G00371620 [Aldrovandia affinis]